MALVSISLVGAVFVVCILFHCVFAKKERTILDDTIRSLPGPKGYPILGSVLDVPDKNSFLKFHEWGLKYGPIYQVTLAGQNHIWISRNEIAQDLLGKRASNYSERPHIPSLTHDNRDSGHYLPLMSRNDLWTRQRRFGKQIMDKSAKAAYYNLPEAESVRLLFELMTDPTRYNHALESYIARISSCLAWGTAEPAEELKQRARELLIGVSPNGSLTNKLGFLKLLPEFLVPAKAWEFRRFRTECRFFALLQSEVRQQLLKPGAPESWMRHFLENKSALGFESDAEAAHAVGMHGIAGALTIAAPMQSFCLAMCHYPYLQPMLHEEIDRVLGDRMPRLSDMPDMPVLRAFIRETLRWRPPVPTGIPHQTVKDDIYRGYHIPAGSVIHPLEWSIGRDPDVFPDPDSFNPARWLESSYPTYQEPLSKYPTITNYSQFGYGRRICQGMGVAEADLFVGIGSIAWMFTLSANDPAEHNTEHRNSVPSVSAPYEKDDTDRGVHIGIQTPPSETEIEIELSQKVPLGGKRAIMEKKVPGRRYKNVTQDYNLVPSGLSRSETVTHKLRVPGSSLPGQFPAFFAKQTGLDPPPESPTPVVAQVRTEDMPSVGDIIQPEQVDPTLENSSLLIAKPLPFRFNMQIRDPRKAEFVAHEWIHKKMGGKIADSRCYWEGGNQGTAEYGWGEVQQ